MEPNKWEKGDIGDKVFIYKNHMSIHLSDQMEPSKRNKKDKGDTGNVYKNHTSIHLTTLLTLSKNPSPACVNNDLSFPHYIQNYPSSNSRILIVERLLVRKFL